MHYVAQLKVEKVDKEPQALSRPANAAEPKRTVEEVTQFTIKADTLEKLVEKLGRHIEIIEEG